MSKQMKNFNIQLYSRLPLTSSPYSMIYANKNDNKNLYVKSTINQTINPVTTCSTFPSSHDNPASTPMMSKTQTIEADNYTSLHEQLSLIYGPKYTIVQTQQPWGTLPLNFTDLSPDLSVIIHSSPLKSHINRSVLTPSLPVSPHERAAYWVNLPWEKFLFYTTDQKQYHLMIDEIEHFLNTYNSTHAAENIVLKKLLQTIQNINEMPTEHHDLKILGPQWATNISTLPHIPSSIKTLLKKINIHLWSHWENFLE